MDLGLSHGSAVYLRPIFLTSLSFGYLLCLILFQYLRQCRHVVVRHCAHFPDAETEVQGERELCPHLHRSDVVALGPGLGLSDTALSAILPTLCQLSLREQFIPPGS